MPDMKPPRREAPALSDRLKRAIEHDRDELWCQALIAVFKFGSPEQVKMLEYFEAHRENFEPTGQRFATISAGAASSGVSPLPTEPTET